MSLSKDKVNDIVESESSGPSLLPGKSNASIAPELKVHSDTTASPDKSKAEEISPGLNATPDLPLMSAAIEKDISLENNSNLTPIDSLDVKLNDLQAEKDPISESGEGESSELITASNDNINITKNVSSDETSKPKAENKSCAAIQSIPIDNNAGLPCVRLRSDVTDNVDADKTCKSTDCQKENLVK